MSKSIQFRRSTAILTLVAASIGGGLIAAFAVATHSNAPVYVTARAATTPNTKATEMSNSFADIIEKASPAVVNISSTRVIKANDQDGQGQNPFGMDPFFQRFFGGPNARPQPQREMGVGSGVIISPEGYILTNNHVIAKATTLKVNLLDGRQFPAKVVGADPQTDVAVVKIDAKNLPVMPFANSDDARVGDLCFAIGDPFEQDHTVTMGIVSAKGRSLHSGASSIQNFIQTDAAINPGNSGGALINTKGQLIGMNTAILTGGGFGGEAGNIGIGFAIPSNMAKTVMDQLIKNGKVSRGYIGVTLQVVNPELAQHLGLKNDHAALINHVTPGKPGDKAGLKVGDAIVAIDGHPVADSNEATLLVTEHAPGSTLALDIIRDGKPMKINVTLGTRPTDANFGEPGQNNEEGNNQGNNENSGKTSYGITVQALTPEIAQSLGIATGVHGVVVDNVDPGAPAAESGLSRGDVITSVDRHPVNNMADFQRLMSAADGKSVLLMVNHRGQSFFVVVQPNNSK